MYAIRVVDYDKKNLPERMLYAVKRAHTLGDLDGLVHIKDDIVQKISYGWEMTSHWDTPEEVAKL